MMVGCAQTNTTPSLDFDSKRKSNNSETNDESRPIVSPETENETGDGTGERETRIVSEYPQPLRLFFVLVATVFRVLLIAPDRVSNKHSLNFQELFWLYNTIAATAILGVTDEFHVLDKVSWYGSACSSVAPRQIESVGAGASKSIFLLEVS